MDHPKRVGDRSTLAAMLALHEAGFTLYTPFGENTRCDLIVEHEGVLSRVQCKTGRLRRGAIEFPLCSSYAHHPNPSESHRGYRGEVEYFAVFCRETGGVYLVPIDHLPGARQASLRVEPTRNGQRKKIRPARVYEIGRVTTGGLRAPSGA